MTAPSRSYRESPQTRRLDAILNAGLAEVNLAETADELALSTRATRVALGTASWGERWRHFWNSPPSQAEHRSAESFIQIRRDIAAMQAMTGKLEGKGN